MNQARALTQARPLEALAHRDSNALGLVRLLLAGLVIVGHAPILMAYPAQRDWGMLGVVAVDGFFIASGFLITMSGERTNFPVFLRHRFLRIFPAYWAAVLLCALVAAPLSTWVLTGSYAWGPSLAFVADHLWLRGHSWAIPGTLPGVVQAGVWLGQCWTLAAEFSCYLIIGLLLCWGYCRRRPAPWVAGLTVAAWLAWVVLALWVPQASNQVHNGARLVTCFLLGACAWYGRGQIRVPAWAGLAGVLAVAAAVWWQLPAVWWPVLPVPIALAVAGGALYLPAGLVQRHDFSYGLYIYGMPVQQVLVQHGGGLPGLGEATPLAVALNILLTLVGAGALAVASWFVVERPALRLKDRPLLAGCPAWMRRR